jgi:hypothetical protein
VQDGIYLSTDQIEPALRNEFWRAVHRPIFDVAPASEGDQLRGSVTARPIGSLTIGSTNINSQIYRRDRQVIVDSGMDHYLLYLLVAGTIKAECDGTSFAARPGDICLFDLTRPYVSIAKTGAVGLQSPVPPVPGVVPLASQCRSCACAAADKASKAIADIEAPQSIRADALSITFRVAATVALFIERPLFAFRRAHDPKRDQRPRAQASSLFWNGAQCCADPVYRFMSLPSATPLPRI